MFSGYTGVSSLKIQTLPHHPDGKKQNFSKSNLRSIAITGLALTALALAGVYYTSPNPPSNRVITTGFNCSNTPTPVLYNISKPLLRESCFQTHQQNFKDNCTDHMFEPFYRVRADTDGYVEKGVLKDRFPQILAVNEKNVSTPDTIIIVQADRIQEEIDVLYRNLVYIWKHQWCITHEEYFISINNMFTHKRSQLETIEKNLQTIVEKFEGGTKTLEETLQEMSQIRAALGEQIIVWENQYQKEKNQIFSQIISQIYMKPDFYPYCWKPPHFILSYNNQSVLNDPSSQVDLGHEKVIARTLKILKEIRELEQMTTETYMFLPHLVDKEELIRLKVKEIEKKLLVTAEEFKEGTKHPKDVASELLQIREILYNELDPFFKAYEKFAIRILEQNRYRQYFAPVEIWVSYVLARVIIQFLPLHML